MFSGTEPRTFDCRKCKQKDDKRCAIWGLHPDVDIWNKVRGDVFTNEDIREFSNHTESAEGSRGTLGFGLISENDTPKSLWSAENWSPQLGRSIAIVNSRKKKGRDNNKGVIPRTEKSKESVLYSLADGNQSHDRQVDKSKSKRSNSYFSSQEDRSQRNGRRDAPWSSSPTIKSSGGGRAKESRLPSPRGKSKRERQREVFERLSQADRSKSYDRWEDFAEGSVQFNTNPHHIRDESVGRNKKYELQSAANGERYNKLNARHAERNTAEILKAEKFRRFNTPRRKATSKDKMSVSDFNQPRHKSMGVKNKKGGSSDESYGAKTDRGHRSTSTSSRRAPSTDSYGAHSDRSSRRRERLSGNTSGSSILENKSAVGYELNSSYRGSDDPNHEVSGYPKRNMTSSQFWKYSMRCLETHPRRGRKPKDCITCEGHEHKNKEIMNEAERLDKAQWTKKFLNRLDGITESSERSHLPRPVHDVKLKEGLKHITTPRRVRDQNDNGWPRPYDERYMELHDEKEHMFHYFDKFSDERKQNKSLSHRKVEYPDREVSKPGRSRRMISGKDPVKDILIPNPCETWKRREEKNKNLGFNSLDKVQRKLQMEDRSISTKQELLKKKNSSHLEKKIRANHKGLGKQESRKVPTNHKVIESQESMEKGFLVNVGKEISRIFGVDSLEDRSIHGMLSNQKTLKELFVSNMKQTTSNLDVDLKSRPTSASTSRKRVHTPHDANRIINSTEANMSKTSVAKRAKFHSSACNLSVGGTNNQYRSVMSSRRPTPYIKHRTRSQWKLGSYQIATKEEENRLISESTKIPLKKPVMMERHNARFIFASGGKTPNRRYCPSTARSSIFTPLACQRFILKEEACKKMMLDQEELCLPKFPQEVLSSRSRERSQNISPCQRFVNHEEKSSLFLRQKHEEDFKLGQETRVSSSPKDRKGSLLSRDQHLQSLQKQVKDLRSPPCDGFKKQKKESKTRLQKLVLRTTTTKSRHARASLQKVKPLRSCVISTTHHEKSKKILEQSEFSRESTPSSKSFWDWKEEEQTHESLREIQRQREIEKPCNRWQTHDNRSQMVLEQARIRLEEELIQRKNDCPISYERCQNCQDKRKEVESLRRWEEINRGSNSNNSPHHKRSRDLSPQ